jgi:hypothetical protein
MAKKKVLWGMPTVALVFGLIIIGCDDGSTTPEPELPPIYTGSLTGWNKNWYNSLPISESGDSRYNEKQWIEKYTDPDDDTGYLNNKDENAILQNNGEYYGVKVDDQWIKISTGFEADGHTKAPEYYWRFSSDWEMTKWETSYSTHGDNDYHKVETKTFAEVDATHLKVGDATYKYEVSVSKTRDIDFTYTVQSPQTTTYRRTGTFKMHILKIWFNGDSSDPDIFLNPEMQTTVMN